MKVTHILARVRGKSVAYDTLTEVEEVLHEQRERIHDQRFPVHMSGAARMEAGELAFQPGLVALAGEAQDSALYLEALLTAARSSGHTELADALEDAAAVYHEAADVLAQATRTTVPAPQMPLGEAA